MLFFCIFFYFFWVYRNFLSFFIHLVSSGLSDGPHFQAYTLWVEYVWGHISEAVCPHQSHLDCADDFFQGSSWVVLFFDLPKSGTTIVQNCTLSGLQTRKFVLANLEGLELALRPALDCGRHLCLANCFVSCASLLFLRRLWPRHALPGNRQRCCALCLRSFFSCRLVLYLFIFL